MAEIHLELDGDLEGEEQLVFLEEARTSVVVDVVSQSVHDVTQATLHDRVGCTLPQRKLKHLPTQTQIALL